MALFYEKDIVFSISTTQKNIALRKNVFCLLNLSKQAFALSINPLEKSVNKCTFGLFFFFFFNLSPISMSNDTQLIIYIFSECKSNIKNCTPTLHQRL